LLVYGRLRDLLNNATQLAVGDPAEDGAGATNLAELEPAD
jgi:hypothetical protein